jgi:ribonuclease HI
MTARSESLIIYTDGACKDNGKATARAGVGVYLGQEDPRNISLPLEKIPHTNNRAELWAIKLAFDLIAVENPMKAVIHSDSNYAIKALTEWIGNWKKNGWKTSTRKPVLNKDIIVEMDKQLALLKKTTFIEFVHVKGHTGELDGNHYADKLATEGIEVVLPSIVQENPPSGKRQRIE